MPEAGEVDEVFSVPLEHVLNPAHYTVQSRRWRGRRRYYYTVPYGPYYIWGATARILRGLGRPDGAVTRVSGDWIDATRDPAGLPRC